MSRPRVSSRRCFFPALWVCAAVILLPAASLFAATDKGPDAHAAIAKGLSWLGANQGKTRRSAGAAGELPRNVAMTAFDGLAFLASGSQPDKGEYAAQIKGALADVLASQQDSGLFAGKVAQGPMYGHGYSTLFVAEVYLKNHDPVLKPKLDKAVGLIEKSASKEGGWRYLPKPIDADVSVTACELNALLACKAGGIKVDQWVIDHAINYVGKCQNTDGGFSYMATSPGITNSGLPRSAAAVAVLLHNGAKPTDKNVARGIEYVVNFFRLPQPPQVGAHNFYGIYYASQWLGKSRGGADYENLTRALLNTQEQNGSWAGDFSIDYATANALIALQAPQKRLWIFGGSR